MENIAVLLTLPDTARSVLNVAEKMKDAFREANISLVYIRPDIDPDLMPTEEVYTEERKAAFESDQDRLLADLNNIAAQWLARGFPPLQSKRGNRLEVAKQALSGADLVILASPHADPDAKLFLETALFEISKPVLLASRVTPAHIGQRIAIAWTPGDAPQKAADAIRPIIEHARVVIVLKGEHKSDFPISPTPELNLAIQTLDVKVKLHEFKLNGRHIGEALLAEAHQAGADLLVMGAFTHSRLREAIFGGATAEILKDFDLPVLMHH